MSAPRESHRSRAALALLMLVALGARTAYLAAHGPWHDEMIALSNAAGRPYAAPLARSPFTSSDLRAERTVAGVARTVVLQDGGNAIAYSLGLSLWIRAVGAQDTAARLPSVLAGVAAVFLAYALARALFGEVTALVAGALVALHPLLVRQSQEIRSYSLATLFALASTILLLQIWRGGERGRPRVVIAYGFATGLAVLSHYLTAPVFVAQAAFALLHVRTREAWLKLLAGWTMAALLTAGWLASGGLEGLRLIGANNELYRIRAASARSSENFALPLSPRSVGAGLVQGFYSLTGNLLQRRGWSLAQLLPTLVVPLVLLGAAYRARADTGGEGSLLLFLCGASGLAWALMLSLRAGHVIAFQPHYQTFLAPYVSILIARGLVVLLASPSLGRGLGALALLGQGAVVALSLDAVYDDRPWNRPANGFARLAGEIRRHVQPGDVVTYPTWTDARMCNLYFTEADAIAQRVEERPDSRIIRVSHDGATRLELESPRDYWLNLHRSKP